MLNSNTRLEFINFPDDEYADAIEQKWFLHQNSHLNYVDHLNFFYVPDDNIESREQLRSYISLITNTNEYANTVMVSKQKQLAFIGWEQDVVAFYSLQPEAINVSMPILVNRLMKFPPYQGAILKKLKIKSKGHFDLVDTKDICFCMGSGNWTEIYMSDGTMRKECKPLGNLQERLSNVSSIMRVGKSLLINRNRVLQITGNDVRFVTDAKAPSMKQRLGEKYIKELRKFIYWY